MLTANEQRITSKHRPVLSILEEIADTVLRMTRCMQCLDLDAAYIERLAMAWDLIDSAAVLAAYDGDRVGLELVRGISRGYAKKLGISRTISTLPPAWSWWLTVT